MATKKPPFKEAFLLLSFLVVNVLFIADPVRILQQ